MSWGAAADTSMVACKGVAADVHPNLEKTVLFAMSEYDYWYEYGLVPQFV